LDVVGRFGFTDKNQLRMKAIAAATRKTYHAMFTVSHEVTIFRFWKIIKSTDASQTDGQAMP